jgi:hypothetical protein
VLLSGFLLAGHAAASSLPKVDFSREILPILSDNCFYCHGPDPSHRKADLRIDTQEGAYEVVVPGRSDESDLIARILAEDLEDRMPPLKTHKVLTPEQIALLKRWIDEGAEWGEHWAFLPVARPTPPVLDAPNEAPVRNPIDAFVQTRLAKEGLAPSPEADRRTLLRRVTLDLTGLSPTPAEMDAFLADSAPDAYERAVDRLLASPHYGERMAWEWMEVARYADTNGYQGDAERTMWPWRDWVIKAFNENLPYDRFLTWQLAGDLLPDATDEQRLATAFNRNHPINGEGGRIAEENRVDYVLDMTETMGTAFLGLTIGCARCHDHKFDPITQKDYFSLSAFFNQTPVTGAGGDPQTKPVIDLSTAEEHAKLETLRERVLALAAGVGERESALATAAEREGGGLPDALCEALSVEPVRRDRERSDRLVAAWGEAHPDYKAAVETLFQARRERDAYNRSLPRVMVMEDIPEPRPTHVLDKGLYSLPKDEVPPGTPGSLPPLPDDLPRNRLGLARWLVDPAHPLTARVTVNRFWQMIFGHGLVKSAEDFGTKGELPTHPELLDWLAAEFRDNGWDVKRLLRLIVTSHAYRQTSRLTPDLREADATNRLYARGPRHRLPSWMLRDQALAASGLLVDRIGGPPVKPYQPAGVWEETTFGEKKYVQDHGEALYRRSLYTFWRRIIAPTEFFDVHTRMTTSVKPMRTNTPSHALTTLNNTTYVEAARALAETILVQSANDTERLDAAYRAVLGRVALPRERDVFFARRGDLARRFQDDPAAAEKLLAVGESPRNPALSPVDHATWTSLCLALLNLEETLNKE